VLLLTIHSINRFRFSKLKKDMSEKNSPEIRIVIIEDHAVVRLGLLTALQSYAGIEVVGEAANAMQGLNLLQTAQPDVAIVDIGLPGMDGIGMTQQFRKFQAANQAKEQNKDQNKDPDKEQPGDTKILMLTMQGNEEAVLASFAAGADSYCIKDIEMDRLVEAIKSTHNGSAWIDPAIASIVLRQMRQGMSQPEGNKNTIEIQAVETKYEEVLEAYPLTNRELEVLELMVAGCTNIAIAERLYITVGTVKTHVRNVLSKLCADDRTEAAVRALRSGIIS
jgi:two-component system, NarL family, response regulator LiaR